MIGIPWRLAASAALAALIVGGPTASPVRAGHAASGSPQTVVPQPVAPRPAAPGVVPAVVAPRTAVGPWISVIWGPANASTKQGPLNAEWVWQNSIYPVAQVAAGGDRVGILGVNHLPTPFGAVLYVLQGSATGNYWYTVGDVWGMSLSSDRVGIITSSNNAKVSEGPLGNATTFVDEYAGAVQVIVSGDRIGVLTVDKRLVVKQGPLNASWSEVARDVESYALTATRIGIVDTAGAVSVKQGRLDAPWTTQYQGASQVVLAGDRIGVLDGRRALVKAGALNAMWVDEAGDAWRLALTPTRIGIVNGNGQALVKEGGLSTLWTDVFDGAHELAMS